MRDLTAERLRELLHYDPETGMFTRKEGRGGARGGDAAGAVTHYGYISIGVDYADYKAHHLAWMWVHGRMPTYLDHINGNKTDNRIANLREASHRFNMENIRAPKTTNKSGLLGVTKVGDRFRSTITVNRTSIHLGMFDTAEDAHQAYLVAKRKLHEGCTI